jgi:hypothetical protein
MDNIAYWALAGLGIFSAFLWEKVKGLERQVKEQEPSLPSGEDPPDAFVLRDHVPALRRVVEAKIWFSREYANTVMGITDEELWQLLPKDVEWKDLPETFLPRTPIGIETWSTHTVMSSRDYTQAPLFQFDLDPTGIWGYSFTGEGPSKGGWLSIALHHGNIVFSAQFGRFGGKPQGGAEDKYTFLSISTKESELEPYKSVLDPELRSFDRHWIRRYEHEDPSGLGWDLRIVDLVDRATQP